MADIKPLYSNADGFHQEASDSVDSIKMLSFKTANYELTDTKLGKLVDGNDANNEHTHDGRYYREDEHVSVSTGVADAGKPIILDAAGLLDDSLIDVSGLEAVLDHGNLQGLADDDHTQYIRVDGTRAFTGDQSLGGFKITSLANPTLGTDAVNLQTMQNYLNGLKPKTGVVAATTEAGTLATSFANGSTVDGVVLATGDRLLIKDQVAASENGIYIVQASGAPVRAEDFDQTSPIDEINGALVGVQEGTDNAGKTFVQQGDVVTVGTDAINFVYFNSADQITASNGLVRVANDIQLASTVAGDGLALAAGILSVNVDSASIEINADTLRVKADGINDTHIDFGVGANQVNAADLPILDAGGFTSATEVESALQELYGLVAQVGVEYTVGTGGVSAGDLCYISGNNEASKYTTLTAAQYCIGLAATTEVASAIVKILANDTVISGVLSGAVAGTRYYWDGAALTSSIPTGAGAYVWSVGIAKNATDLAVEVRHIKRNAVA